jgi:hypothetical protein
MEAAATLKRLIGFPQSQLEFALRPGFGDLPVQVLKHASVPNVLRVLFQPVSSLFETEEPTPPRAALWRLLPLQGC